MLALGKQASQCPHRKNIIVCGYGTGKDLIVY
jgi:hypothetical protein